MKNLKSAKMAFEKKNKWTDYRKDGITFSSDYVYYDELSEVNSKMMEKLINDYGKLSFNKYPLMKAQMSFDPATGKDEYKIKFIGNTINNKSHRLIGLSA